MAMPDSMGMSGSPIPDDQKPTASQVMDQQLSVMNPDDAFRMAEKGLIRKDMTVREFFQLLGVDVDGPVTQLADMVKREAAKANPVNKMKALGGARASANPLAGMSAGAGSTPVNSGSTSGGSLDDLMASMGR